MVYIYCKRKQEFDQVVHNLLKISNNSSFPFVRLSHWKVYWSWPVTHMTGPTT